MAVKLNQIGMRFGNLQVLRDISFEVKEGEFVALLGPSGCGKTTLLKIIAGILAPTEGETRVNGDSPDMARRKRQIGYVFQTPALLKNRTVLGNIALPLEIAGLPRRVAYQKARQALELVRLVDFEGFLPHQLSGGMKQRVAIARVFVTDCLVLLMDEPFGSLDTYNREKMGEKLLEVWQRAGGKRTVIFVTHDPYEAAFLSDKVFFLSGGPGKVKAQIKMGFARPRSADLRVQEEFFKMTSKLRQLYKEDEYDQ